MSTTAVSPSLATGKRTPTVWVLILFTVVSMFSFVDRIFIQVLVQPIKGELHVSDADMGLLGGLTFAVLYAVLSIPIARLAVRCFCLAFFSFCLAFWSLAFVVS